MTALENMLVILGAVILFSLEVAGVTDFISPSVDTDRFINRTDDISMEWEYQLDSTSVSVSFQCGYRKITPVWLIYKDGSNAPTVDASYQNRVEVLPTQTNKIGFKLKRCDFSDAGSFGCQMIYGGNPRYSKLFILQIYERPRFIDCLGQLGQRFQLNEGQPINTTCTYYGNPLPTLRCQALDGNGMVVRSTNPEEITTNLTGSNRLIINDIRRQVKTIKCTASHQQTGKAETTRAVIVYHTPGPPTELKRVRSTYTSITVSWKPPQETGNKNIITYFVETESSSFVRNGTNYTRYSNLREFEYTFNYLQSSVGYKVYVSAFNELGKGAAAEATYKTVPFTPMIIYPRRNLSSSTQSTLKKTLGHDSGSRTGSKSNTGLIVGLVIGGIVLLVIIVLVAVYFYRRRNEQEKKYPTSFVEESVDYPLSDPSMYAHVNKKKQPGMQEQNSTSGYPDIIHQAKGNPRAHPSEKETLNKGSADDHSISPSYESSKKEYV